MGSFFGLKLPGLSLSWGKTSKCHHHHYHHRPFGHHCGCHHHPPLFRPAFFPGRFW